ncbi:MAG: molybdopterin-dependent oxidoreductase [Chloroflexota bacterium]|nr:molybdopterin-dependent oxidoreductase [Chloroflexota bacterium]
MPEVKMVNVTIDGIEISVPKGTFLIEAAKRAGIYISNFCAHSDMRPFGACRMCTVGVMGWKGLGFEIACAAECKDGLVAFTENTNDSVREVKKFIMEALLVDHPLDCPICPASGACDLQNATWHYGMTENRMAREKIWYEQDYLSPAILIKRDRCVLCGQCVRVCEELVGAHALTFVNRGIDTYIDSAWGEDLTKSSCTSCGLCVEVCPVGCLMHVQYEATGLQWTMKRTSTTCNYCAVGCQMNFEAENNTGIIEKVTMSEGVGLNDSRSCVKGRYGYQYINHGERLTKPLIRKGKQFKEISWEEAYKEIIQRLTLYSGNQFGAIASTKTTNEENYLLMKLTRGWMRSNNIDSAARFSQAASIAALESQLGISGMTNTIQDIKDYAGCYFITGSNLDDSAPVIAYLLQEAIQRRKVKAIVVSPRRVKFCDRAVMWLQIVPGTDATLYNGLAHIILNENLYDQNFVNSRTDNFSNWKASVAEWNPQRVSQITGISVEDLHQAAILYATGGAGAKGRNKETNLFPPSAILYGTGVTQWVNGTDNVHALANLALLTGNLGREGAGLNGIRDSANEQGACDMGCLPNYLPGYVSVTSDSARAGFEIAWSGKANGSIPKQPGLTYMDMFKAAEQGQIRAMYIMGDNPMLAGADLSQVERGLERLDFLLVQDIFMTETALFADIILPAASHAEKDGTFTNTERRVNRIKKAVASPGFARPDWKILADLLNRSSLSANYKTAEDVMAEIVRANRDYAGITYKKLDRSRPYFTYKPGMVYNQMAPVAMEKAGMQWPTDSTSPQGQDETYILFETGFPTANGKASFVKVAAAGNRRELSDFPIILCIGRTLSQDHSGAMTRRNMVLESLALEPELELNIVDMQELGLQDGDIVQITSAKNLPLEVKVKTSAAQAQGHAFMPWGFKEAPAKILMQVPVDPRSGTPELKYLPIRIERVSTRAGLVSAGSATIQK